MRFRLTVALFVIVSLAASPAMASSGVSDGLSSLSVEEMKIALSAVPPAIRKRLSDDKGAMNRYFANLLQDTRVAADAKASGYADRPEIRAMTDKAARDSLVSRYLDEQMTLAASKSTDFRALAREHFEANRKAFVRPEAIRVAHILISVDVEDERFDETKMRAKALDILEQLKGGADFAKLAKENSGDRASLSRGGEMPGWVERGKTVPPFEKAAFDLKVGETSGLVRTRFGFHIIRKLDYRKEVPQDFAEVEPQLIARMRAEHQNNWRESVMKRYLGAREVDIDDATFDALKAN